MGVHKLWEILEPAKQILPLEHLVGQRLCVDLSYWIIQLNKVNGGNVKDKPHLRGLFHRIRALMALNCHLILVTDGAIPAVKADVYKQRLGNAPKTQPLGLHKKVTGPLKRNKGSEFGRMIEDAKALASAFGLPCLVSLEEGEAQCAALNKMGFCDACFTADSDALLFGAEVVYKDISLGEGHVIAYDMAKVREELGYGRNSLIALGILLGCDYFPGIHGLGPEKAQQLVKKFGEDKILQVMSKEGPVTFAKRLFKTSKSRSKDQHHQDADKENTILFTGPQCFTEDDEVACKAISAYITPKCHSRTSQAVQSVLLGGPVQMDQIRKICMRDFEWPFEKTDEYVLPKLAERDVHRMASMQMANRVYEAGLQYKILEIIKKRQLQGVEYYEVKWTGTPETFSSIVRADIVKRAYPCQVAEFTAKWAAKKTKSARGSKAVVSQTDKLTTSMQRLFLEPDLVWNKQPGNGSSFEKHLRTGNSFLGTNGPVYRGIDDLMLQNGRPLPKQDCMEQHEVAHDKAKQQEVTKVTSRVEFIDLTTPPKHSAPDGEIARVRLPRDTTNVGSYSRLSAQGEGDDSPVAISPEVEHQERVRDLKNFIAGLKSRSFDL